MPPKSKITYSNEDLSEEFPDIDTSVIEIAFEGGDLSKESKNSQKYSKEAEETQSFLSISRHFAAITEDKKSLEENAKLRKLKEDHFYSNLLRIISLKKRTSVIKYRILVKYLLAIIREVNINKTNGLEFSNSMLLVGPNAAVNFAINKNISDRDLDIYYSQIITEDDFFELDKNIQEVDELISFMEYINKENALALDVKKLDNSTIALASQRGYKNELKVIFIYSANNNIQKLSADNKNYTNKHIEDIFNSIESEEDIMELIKMQSQDLF